MKRLFTTLFLCSLLLNLLAQEHLTFNGQPIDGNISQFVSALKGQGYNVVDMNDESCLLNGTYAGQSNCDIIILSTEKSHVVSEVVIYLPAQTSWNELKSQYNDYKNSLIQKYGKPSLEFHDFNSPYYEGDGNEFEALSNFQCTYAAYFDLNGGTVTISINSKKYNSGCVSFFYKDKINAELKEREQ